MKQEEISFGMSMNPDKKWSLVLGDVEIEELDEIGYIYEAYDALSKINAKRYRYSLMLMTYGGALFSIYFFLFNNNGDGLSIIFCLLLLLGVYAFYKRAIKRNYHRKYIEYRLLAESLRVQYFLSRAGMDYKVVDMLPEVIKKSVPVIEEELRGLKDVKLETDKSSLQYWISSQREYHIMAFESKKMQKKQNDALVNVVKSFTVISFLVIVIFELLIIYGLTGGLDLNFIPDNVKVMVGLLSILSLSFDFFYRKLSLFEIMVNHRRMIAIYNRAEKTLNNGGDFEGVVLSLAHECLIENCMWYAYLNQNKVELFIEVGG